jgi:DNA topoisomerase VI subunit B
VRRSTTIPPLPTEVKFHPSSVDNLLVSQLLQASKAPSLAAFLVKDLQGVDPGVASRLVAELGAWAADLTPDGVAQSAQRVMALTQVGRVVV